MIASNCYNELFNQWIVIINQLNTLMDLIVIAIELESHYN